MKKYYFLIITVLIAIALFAATGRCTASKDWLVELNDSIGDAPNNYDIVHAYAKHNSSKFFVRIILNGTCSTEIYSGYGVRIYTDNATYILGFCAATEYMGPHLLVSYDGGQSWETLQSSIEGKVYNNTIDLAVNLSDLQNFPWRIDFVSGIIFNPYAYEIKDETDEVRYPPIAYELLKAMDLEDEYLINCSLSGNLSSVAVFDNYSIFLPTKGSTFTVLSSGNVSDIPGNPSDFISTDFGVEGVSGDTVTLTAYIDVSEGCNCLKVDFVFLSEEYPEWVGSLYNDFFYILLDGENIAFDPNGNIINVNNAFFDPNITPANSFDGQTPLLTTAHPVDPGVHRIDFQVGDVGDGIYDTAAFIDNLVISYEEPGQCVPVTKPNEPPIAKINIIPSVIYEGSKVIFNASDSYDPDGIIVSYTWDFGDGGNGTGTIAEHTYIENGVYNLSLTVVDDKGATNTTIINITVKNAPPIVDAGKDKIVVEGDNVSFYGTFKDPGLLDTHIIEWDFGDGTSAIGTLTPTHAYNTTGIYPVKLTVTDDDYGVGIDTLNVTVLPKIEVVSPNGGEILYGTTEIVWNTSTSVDLVDIEIFDGYTYKKIASNISNTGLYMWNTSETPDGSYKIRIIGKNVTYSLSNSDLSDDWFNIYNSFSVKVSASSTYSKTVEFEKEQYGITVTNKEPFNDTFNIEVENIDGASIVELSENTASIGAFDSKVILLNVTNDDTGIYGVRVVVTSQAHPNVKSDVAITTEVLPSFSVDIEAPEIRTSIGGNLTYKILITNHQKVGDEFLIDVSGISSDWYSVERTIRLSGGEIREIPLEIQVPEDAEFGTYNVIVSVTSTNNGKIKEALKSLIVEEFSIYDLLPANGTHTGSRDVLIMWRTPVNSTSSVFVRRKSGGWICFEGKTGIYHSVLVTNLSRNTWYEFYVMSNTNLASAISEIRSVYIENGIVFTQKYYNFTVERDYDQRVMIFVKNTDKKSHKLLVNLTNPYEGIIAGFVGEGSIDKIITLAPSEMKGLTLVVHAQDARRENYTLLLNLTNLDEEEKIYDYAYLNLRVRIPNIHFTIEELYTDPLTLTKRFRVTNYEDLITDLKVYAIGELEGNVTFQPTINHLYLRTGQSVEFNVTPILTEDFAGLSGKIVAEGAGRKVPLDVEFKLPEGKKVYVGGSRFYHWKHVIPDATIIFPEYIMPGTVGVYIGAIFNGSISNLEILNETINDNKITIYVNSTVAEESEENLSSDEVSAIISNLTEGLYIVEVKESTLGVTLAKRSVEVKRWGLIFNSSELNITIHPYKGILLNNTFYLTESPLIRVLPPLLSKYTNIWVNSTEDFFLGLNISSNKNLKQVVLKLKSSDARINITPDYCNLTLSDTDYVMCLFNVNISNLPHGIYNVTYSMNYATNTTNRAINGTIKVGVYELYTSSIGNNSISARFISPFNDTVNYTAEDWFNFSASDGYIWLPLNKTLEATFSNFTLKEPESPWLHIVIGGAIGAIVNGGVDLSHQIFVEHKSWNDIDWGHVAWKAAEGGLAGASIAAFDGAAPTIAATFGAGALISGAVNFAEQTLQYGEIRNWGEVAYNAWDGGVSSLAFEGAFKLAGGYMIVQKGTRKGMYLKGSWKKIGELGKSKFPLDRIDSAGKYVKRAFKLTRLKTFEKGRLLLKLKQAKEKFDKLKKILKLLRAAGKRVKVEEQYEDPWQSGVLRGTLLGALMGSPYAFNDSDRDGIPNIVEIEYGSDPFDPYSTPGILASFHMRDWYCTNRPVITTLYYMPSTIPETLSPEKNVEEAYLIIRFTLPWKRSAYRPHDVHILLNGHEVGNLTNTIPEGTYIFKFDPSLINYAGKGIGKNTITLKTMHMNGGHYVVSSDIKVVLKVKQIKMPVIASSKDEADEIVMNITGAMKNLPDLYIQPENIGIGKKPIANMPTTLNVTIYNIGTVDAHDVLIRIFDNNSKIEELVIPMLPAMSSENVTVNWTPLSGGTHIISVEINPDRSIPELDYINNEASKSILVSTPDMTPPSIYNAQPLLKIKEKYPKICAEFSDSESGINKDSVRIIVNNNDVTDKAILTSMSVSYTPLVPLEDGIYIVSVYAEDYAMNSKILNWSFVVDTKAPAPISNLSVLDKGATWILWRWEKPSDKDFDHVEVWMNGMIIANVSAPVHEYNVTGLKPNTIYNISIRTVDDIGNINKTWVNDTAITTGSLPSGLNINVHEPDNYSIYPVGEILRFDITVTDSSGHPITSGVSAYADLKGPYETSRLVMLSKDANNLTGEYIVSEDDPHGIWTVNLTAYNDTNSGHASVKLFFTGAYFIYPGSDKRSYVLGEHANFTAMVMKPGNLPKTLTDHNLSLNFSIYPFNSSIPILESAEMMFDDTAGIFYKSIDTGLLGSGLFTVSFIGNDTSGNVETANLLIGVSENFTVTLSTDRMYYDRGEPVSIYGRVRFENNSPLSNANVSLQVNVRGFTRSYSTITNETGEFNYAFQPFDVEAGNYTVKAAVANMGLLRTAESHFTIHGLYLSPPYATVNMSENSTQNIKLTLYNLGETTLTGVTVSVKDLNISDNIYVTINSTNILTELQPCENTSIILQINAGKPVPDKAVFLVNVTTDQISNEFSELCVNLFPQTPVMVLEPTNFVIGLNKNQTAIKTVKISNIGYGVLRNITLHQSENNWMEITSNTSLGDLQPGESITFDIHVHSYNADIGTYHGMVNITSDNYKTLTLDLITHITDLSNGSLLFYVEDAIGRNISGANITLINETTFDEYNFTTNNSGYALIKDLPVGRYIYEVYSGNDTLPQSGSVLVEPMPTPKLVNVSLSLSFISFDWDITPTIIKDLYTVTLKMKFETDVPIPVLVAYPPLLEYNMKQGEEISGTLNLINLGMVSLKDITISKPDLGPYAKVEMLVTSIPEIKAKSSVQVPFKVTLSESAPDCQRLSSIIDINGRYIHYVEGKETFGIARTSVGININTPVVPECIEIPQIPIKICVKNPILDMIYGIEPECLALDRTYLPVLSLFECGDIVSLPSISDEYKINATNCNNIDESSIKLSPAIGLVFKYGIEEILSQYGISIVNKYVHEELLESERLAICENLIKYQHYYEYWYYEDVTTIFSAPIKTGIGIPYIDSVLVGTFNPPVINPEESSTLDLKSISTSAGINLPKAIAGAAFFVFGPSDRCYNCLWIIPTFGIKANIPCKLPNMPQIPEITFYMPVIPEFSRIYPDSGKIEVSGIHFVYPYWAGIPTTHFVYPYRVGIPTTPYYDQQTRYNTLTRTIHEIVTLSISQNITMERDAFWAGLGIRNRMSDKSIENVRVNLLITDENGSNANEKFFIKAPRLDGISNIDGAGIISPLQLAKAQWLIIPKPGAGGTNGQKYNISANISYRVDGVKFEVTTKSIEILVKPQPQLTLDYYIPSDVIANKPFKLAVRVTNDGYGTARNFSIETAQPVIYNPAGLLIDFKIIRSALQGEDRGTSLKIDFGDIQPGESKFAWWEMVTTLNGTFTEFTGTYTHSSELGGMETSLIKALNTHIIMKEIDTGNVTYDFLVDSDNDCVPDWIVNALYGSSEEVYPVNYTVIRWPVIGNPIMTIKGEKLEGKWIYTSVEDPYENNVPITMVVRSDGKILPPSNYWTGDGRIFIVDDPTVKYNITFNLNWITLIANFTHSPENPTVNQTITFDASSSFGPDGNITKYKWDFGDGNITEVEEPVITHTYLIAGNYTVKLTVTDDKGAKSSISRNITVRPVINQPPIANANGPYAGIEGQPVEFNASLSYDPEGKPLTYYWEFGDGETAVTIQPTTSHVYAQQGNYTVTLIVNDSVQNSTPSITYALINDTEPIAEFTANVTSGFAPLRVQFNDSSVSYDGITAWEWDFDGDGTVDSNEQNPIYIYTEAGTYTVKLTVHESDGDSDTETKTDYITVTSAADTEPPTIESVTLDTYINIPNSSFHVTVEATDNIGVVSVKADGIPLNETGSRWEGDIFIPEGTPKGEYTLTITAQDEAGNTAESSVNYSVVFPQGGFAVAVDPMMSFANVGDVKVYQIKIISNENFDDRLHVYISDEGIPDAYRADFEFNRTDKTVYMMSGDTVELSLEVTIPSASGYRMFRVYADSMRFRTSGYCTGIVLIS